VTLDDVVESNVDGHSIRRFSLQTLLVWTGLACFLIAVCVRYPGYIFEAFTISVGLYLIHQAWHTRFKHWRAGIVAGSLICLIGVADWLLGLTLQDLIESEQQLREVKVQLLQGNP